MFQRALTFYTFCLKYLFIYRIGIPMFCIVLKSHTYLNILIFFKIYVYLSNKKYWKKNYNLSLTGNLPSFNSISYHFFPYRIKISTVGQSIRKIIHVFDIIWIQLKIHVLYNKLCINFYPIGCFQLYKIHGFNDRCKSNVSL